MTELTRQSLDEFLDALADRQPTPGGGAVAAVCGALAASLGRMVAAYSICKKTTDDVRNRIDELSEQLRTLDELQRALISQDAEAYLAMSEAGRAARNDPSVQPEHQKAILGAVAVPMEIAAVALRTLTLFDRAKNDVSRYMVSDLGVAAMTAWAAVESASYMVRVNVPEIDDPDIRGRTAKDIGDVCRRAAASRASLQSFVAERLEPGA